MIFFHVLSSHHFFYIFYYIYISNIYVSHCCLSISQFLFFLSSLLYVHCPCMCASLYLYFLFNFFLSTCKYLCLTLFIFPILLCSFILYLLVKVLFIFLLVGCEAPDYHLCQPLVKQALCGKTLDSFICAGGRLL